MHASAVVKRQLTAAFSRFLRSARAPVCRHIAARSGMRRSRRWRTMAPIPVPATSGQPSRLGGWWISSRAAIRAAPSGGNVLRREPTVWTFRLSITGTMRLPGKVTSTGPRMTLAQSLRVRRSVTFTFRQPGGGEVAAGPGRDAPVPPSVLRKTKDYISHAVFPAAAISWSLRCPRFHDATRSSGFRLQRNGRASLALWCPV